MGKRNDTSKSRPSRNRTGSKARSASNRTKPADDSAQIPNLDALEGTIEEERSRLMIAHSLLNCAAIAMEAEDVCTRDSPHYPSIVEMARDLVNQSINGLDSVARNRVMREEKLDADEDEFEDGPDPALHGKYMVKEPSAVYGCRMDAIGSWPPAPRARDFPQGIPAGHLSVTTGQTPDVVTN